MKKIIAVLMTAVMLLGAASCERREDRRGNDEGITLEDLKANDGPMLVVESVVRAPVPDDYDRYNSITLNYDGSLDDGNTISDEDYMTLYNFCVESIKNDTYEDYIEYYEDGITYSFTFYDEDGEEHVIYDGYIYECEELDDIANLIFSYGV